VVAEPAAQPECPATEGAAAVHPGVVVVNVPYHLGVPDQGWLGGTPASRAATTQPVGTTLSR
jgi:hypothetical protein